jgi:hypothetical protein
VTLLVPCARALRPGAFTLMLLLSACGGSTATVTPSSSPAASSTPNAEATPFAGTGFRANVPSGWQDQTTNQSALASLNAGGSVLMLLLAPDQGIIAASTTAQPVADDQLSQYLTSITPPGAIDVSKPEPVDIDGVSGVLMTYQSGTATETEQMVVNQAGNTYEIVLRTLPADFATDAAALQEVLDSWTWA